MNRYYEYCLYVVYALNDKNKILNMRSARFTACNFRKCAIVFVQAIIGVLQPHRETECTYTQTVCGALRHYCLSCCVIDGQQRGANHHHPDFAKTLL